jgi:hypothetical protein
MDEAEISILRVLDSAVRRQSVRSSLKPFVARAEHKLVTDPVAPLAWEPVPLDIYGESLPSAIKSSWVFVLRAGADTGPEKHPNSLQRMVSFRGSGDLQTGDGEKWSSNFLVSDAKVGLTKRCLSIPPDTWHRAVVPQANWVVVSFHTAKEDELIEERPDKYRSSSTVQRKYMER